MNEIATFIEKYKSEYTVKLIYKVLKFPGSPYYKALVSTTFKSPKRIKVQIRKIWVESKSRYGAPKIHKALINGGEKISLKRVQRYMADMDICSIVVKKFNHHLSRSALKEKDNIINNKSFHSVLKKEEVNHHKYYDFNVARKAIFEYIESWYNRKRIHGSIDYMTPQAVHEAASVTS
ncbi:IS3 family transposase [Tepidanaerobacter sp. EBM-49]|uniref:IS3 family transposase n=1 Tax=Tepidanaerobacter sp. EBM-49 TaxID=1918504 RepID=UPI00257C82D0|nr:IS3 family transposase [Tepidanaerobacter sp. EBM-49]